MRPDEAYIKRLNLNSGYFQRPDLYLHNEHNPNFKFPEVGHIWSRATLACVYVC